MKSKKYIISSLINLYLEKEKRFLIIQALVFIFLCFFFLSLINNLLFNLSAVGKDFNFSFLWTPAQYDITSSLIPYKNTDTHLKAGFVGFLNTLLVSVIGIFFATSLGFFLAIMRLSSNWLVKKISHIYIEIVRNIPLLLHIIFIYSIFLYYLPKVTKATSFFDMFFLSNRGLIIPRPIFHSSFKFILISFVLAIIFNVTFNFWAKKKQENTGRIYPILIINSLVLFILPLIIFFIFSSSVTFEIPKLGRFDFSGGLNIYPEFVALTGALILYTAAFIAEIVRAAIVSIKIGQWEASYSLGFSKGKIFSLIIIPQALRVLIPPLTNQYLNLTKNSSLAIAIGYMDIVATIGGISLMQTGREVETMLIVMGIYLFLSLFTSFFMNCYNRSFKWDFI